MTLALPQIFDEHWDCITYEQYTFDFENSNGVRAY